MDGDGSSGDDNISRVISTQQLENVNVLGTGNGTYAISIDSVSEASYVALGNSQIEIATGLLAAWTGTTNSVSAELTGTNALLLESTDEWDTGGFTCAVTLEATANTSNITTETLVAQAQSVAGGIGVCTDDRAATSGTQCRLPRHSTDITARFLGITRMDTAKEASSSEIYQNQNAVSIKRRGRIWVRVQNAVAEMGDVYCRYASPVTGYGLGSFRADADSSTAAKVPNAQYVTSAGAGGLALVQL
jgi:hypothetical protein